MPDNIEGVQVGDTVYFHVTNLEQDWDVPHGFAVTGRQQLRAADHAGRDPHARCGCRRRSGVYPVLLHRLLLGAAPGDAGIRPRVAAAARSVALTWNSPTYKGWKLEELSRGAGA